MREPLPEERAAGTEDAQHQVEVILEESEERLADRDAAPGSRIEHRQSEDVVEPPAP